jgi:hypothetical protein
MDPASPFDEPRRHRFVEVLAAGVKYLGGAGERCGLLLPLVPSVTLDALAAFARIRLHLIDNRSPLRNRVTR